MSTPEEIGDVRRMLRLSGLALDPGDIEVDQGAVPGHVRVRVRCGGARAVRLTDRAEAILRETGYSVERPGGLAGTRLYVNRLPEHRSLV